MKKFFEKNKDKIFIWVCVGLIAIIVLLVFIFQRNDVEQINANKSDIVLNDFNDNLKKNEITWYYGVISYGNETSFRVNTFGESTFLVNENDNITYNNWYMDFVFINLDVSNLLETLNYYYGSGLVPSNLYLNFTFYASTNNDDIALVEYFGTTFTFSYLYFPSDYNYYNDFPDNISSSTLIPFMRNSVFSYFDYTLNAAYLSNNNDYVGFNLSIPLDLTKQYFNIVLPTYDYLSYTYNGDNGEANLTYNYYFDEESGVISDKNFLESDNFNDLENRYNTLNNNYNDYVNSHSYDNSQYNNLVYSNNQLEATNTQLSNTNNQLEATNTQLSNTNSQLEATNTQLSNTNSQLQSDYNSLDANYNTLLNQYNTLLHQTDYSFSELFWSISAVPMGVLTSAFNVNVLGVNLRGIITGLFTALLIIWIIKKLF